MEFLILLVVLGSFASGNGNPCELVLQKDGNIIEDGEHVVGFGGDINQIYCKALCSGPGPTPALKWYREPRTRPISWFRGRVYQVRTTFERVSILTIRNMLYRDTATYRCRGWLKDVGWQEKSFELVYGCKDSGHLCDTSKCISQAQICDGEQQCKDGTDEQNCLECKINQFHCDDGDCIQGDMRCDGFFDCVDGSDEYNCGCSPDFTCSQGGCVSQDKVCDGTYDCMVGEDEVNCTYCEDDEFHCGKSECIAAELVCNGWDDCAGGSDETTCCIGRYQCLDGMCLATDEECDGFPDCSGGEDEVNCTYCEIDEYHCGAGECIPEYELCDRVQQCDDGSDELNCGCYDDYTCSDGTCIDVSKVCDGSIDCNGDGGDELDCKTCSEGFLCTDGSRCISTMQVCDGKQDCDDGLDENDCKTPEDISFNVQSPITYLDGKSISVICLLGTDVGPDAQLSWFGNNGVQISNTDTSTTPHVMSLKMGSTTGLMLNLGAATSDMAGVYKCKATINAVETEKELVINVEEALRLRDCADEQFGILGQKSEVKCTATAGGNLVTTYWNKKGSTIDMASGKYVQHETSLKILDTELSDAGTYTYAAVSLADSQSEQKDITFRVYTAPTIVQPLLQTTAIVGRKAALYCKAKGIPDPEIEWRKAGSTNILRTTDRITVIQKKEGEDVQGILNFTSVMKEDEAAYTCTAKNLASDSNQVDVAETTDDLIVQIPPKIENIADGKGKEGGPGSLTCVARGDPVPKMIWVKVKTGERFSSGTTSEGITVEQQDLTDPGNFGSRLTLSFSQLKHSDAGEYKCEATNLADTAEATVNLEVQYKPNFNDQGQTNFYNWLQNPEPYITCTVDGNPLPSFRWYKGDREITAGDTFHSIINSDIDPEKPHRVVSKLQVTFNGNNNDAVFGGYKCEASNLLGVSEIALSMEQAERPGEPSVSVHDKDASHFEFWLEGPNVKGPEVEYYKVTYVKQGSGDKAKEETYPREYRDYIDESRRYTIIYIRHLNASTTYVFTFYAINDVGIGPGNELIRATEAISEPDEPVITTQSNSPNPTSILVQWMKPNDGGSQILFYRITHQRVTVKTNSSFDSTKGYEIADKFKGVNEILNIKDTSYTIDNLIPGTYYEIKVYARNGKGYSLPGQKVIRTQIDPSYDPASSGVSRWEPVKDSVTIFGCLVTLCACLKSLM